MQEADYGDEGSGCQYDDIDDYEGEYEDGEGGTGNAINKRSKRRSKNDNVGRTFVCGCNKSYLSYPALYTHIKQKHDGHPPEGTNSAQYNTGRGRGRPRKEKPKTNLNIVVAEDNNDAKQNEAKMVSQLSRDLTSEMLSQESQALSRVHFPLAQKQIASLAAQFNSTANGDNFTALNWYSEEPDEDDILYKVVQESFQQVMLANKQIEEQDDRFEKKADAGPSTQYLLQVTDEDRALFTVDQVMALYLIDVADRCKKCPPVLASGLDSIIDGETTRPGGATGSKAALKNTTGESQGNLERNNYHFYMNVAVFTQLYRTCLNESIQSTFQGRAALASQNNSAGEAPLEPTQTRSPDCIPLVCNEFMREFLPLKCNIFDTKTAIGLTQHFNLWLYNRKFTKTRISLLQQK